MKRNIYCLLLIIVLIFSCRSIDDSGFSPFSEAPLFGIFYDSESSPVVGAEVVLDNGNPVITDINGRVLFSQVSCGEHSVVISKEGFEETRMELNFVNRSQVLYSTLISLQNILDNLESSLQTDKITEAKSFLERALKIDSDDIRFKYLKIVYLTKINEYQEALKEIDLLLESYPDDPYIILTHIKITEKITKNITGETNDKN